MQYSHSLPPVRLKQEELQRLHDVVVRGSTVVGEKSESLQLHYGEGFSNTYDGLPELFSDPNREKEVYDVDWKFGFEEGSVRIYFSGSHSELRIVGGDDWVKARKADIEAFFAKHSSLPKRIVKNNKSSALGLVLIILGFLASVLIYAYFTGLFALFGELIGVCGILIGVIFQLSSYQQLMPFAAFELEQIHHKYVAEQILTAVLGSLFALVIVFALGLLVSHFV